MDAITASLGGADPTPPGPLPYADILNPQSLNKYVYAYNNPLRYNDPTGRWPSYVNDIHARIIERAFPGLSARQRQILKEASRRVDSPSRGGQEAGNSYMHAMRFLGQPAESAQQMTATFIKANEQQAQSLQASFEKGGGVGMSNQALDAFGTALHPITDNTTPSHEGTQVWDPHDEAGVAKHVANESTISEEQMDRAVQAARDAYKNTFGSERLDQATHKRKQW